MAEAKTSELFDRAAAVLKKNNRGKWVVPASDLYPHQWLWDSCFIAIGLRHLDVDRAKTELTSLLRGQWSNGMLPHIIFADAHGRDSRLWRSYVSPHSPADVATSGLTQPPMLAEAVVQIGKRLKVAERRTWYSEMYPYLIAYHEWLYRERDPHQEGLVLLLHPYECGLDNTPPWISELRKHSMPWWISLIERLHLDGFINIFRRDTKHISPNERMSNIEALGYFAAMLRLRRKAYNTEAILSRSLFAVEDLAFNCIFIRANAHLRDIASTIKREIPETLSADMDRTEKALEQLWDEPSGQYFSRSFASHKQLQEPTVATLLPLYAGSISKARAEMLAEDLKNPKTYGAKWPVPSVPLNSPDFKPIGYWQGPSWVNMNWLIIQGLANYGFHEQAENLRQKTLELVDNNGLNEYFNPISGAPAGADNFSWTAALTIDLIKQA